MKQPKGLRLFDRDQSVTSGRMDLDLELDDTEFPGGAFITVNLVEATLLDAAQLDKLAERCKQFAAYLRALPKKQTKKPKWEDL